jgi:predicted RNase H-like HicB family nuclease
MSEVITLDVKLRAFVRKDTEDRWVSVCPRLGVASQAATADEAKDALREVVELWFESCVERGVLDQAMRELGLLPHPAKEEPPHLQPLLEAQMEAGTDIRGNEFNVHAEAPRKCAD